MSLFLVKAEPTEMEDNKGNKEIGFCAEDIEEVKQLDSDLEEKITNGLTKDDENSLYGKWALRFFEDLAPMEELIDKKHDKFWNRFNRLLEVYTEEIIKEVFQKLREEVD
jgi:hypothetical protein